MLEKSILHGLRAKNTRNKSRLKSQVPELRHNSEHVDHVIGGTGRPQEHRIFKSLKTHKKIAFYPNRKIFSPRFIA